MSSETENTQTLIINHIFPVMSIYMSRLTGLNCEKLWCLTLFFPSFQTLVLDLKEKASSLASSTLKKDNRLKSLEISMEQKKEECIKLENQLKKVS